MNKDQDVQIKDKLLCYQGYFDLYDYRFNFRQYSGEWSGEISREIFCRPRSVAVLPYDPDLDQIVVIEQLRIGALSAANPWLIEIVAGGIEADESIEAVAKRETLEETGLAVLALQHISQVWVSPGSTNECVDLFCARVDLQDYQGGIFGLESEGEDIRASVLATDAAIAKVHSGEINSAPAMLALLWLQTQRLSGQQAC